MAEPKKYYVKILKHGIGSKQQGRIYEMTNKESVDNYVRNKVGVVVSGATDYDELLVLANKYLKTDEDLFRFMKQTGFGHLVDEDQEEQE